MALYVKRPDWTKGINVPTQVNEAVVEEVLNYIFCTNTWKQNPDALVRKVPRWRERLFATPAAIVGAPENAEALAVVPTAPSEPLPPPEAPHWTEVAVGLKAGGKSWGEVARTVGKPVGTVRDNVNRLRKMAPE